MKRKGSELAVLDNRAIKKAHEEGYAGRVSNLFAPIMALEGHQGEIFSVKFHPEGQYLASTGFDRQIFIWTTYGECVNISAMTGHSGAILELHFSTDGGTIFTCSTDHTVAMWDLETCQRIKKLKGHNSFVNTCHPARRGPQLIASGSDDCTIKVWDSRKKGQAITLNNTYQVTAVTFSDTAEQVLSGGIDNDIKIWDLRKNALIQRMRGHTDSVTGLCLSPDGSYVLSNSMDNSLRIWDIRPYAPQERCVKILSGHQHNFEKNLLRCCWSPDGSKVSAGSADRYVYIWDTTTRRILYKLPGHNGSVNDVHFHPNEPIIMSGSSDKVIYLGELE
ncbi:U5 small nuclear ribonucleoprotein 40 kDa protein [Lycorma delicatula]|uniref:U5 small nuclear ribonucleoprotein 40 kDa protein n=1 Tax=Lycorma delicatula TaxID=130591 RepID=UPI003F5115DD